MKILLITLASLAQLSVPASMIYQHESTLKNGTAYRFEVRPVDPADPFRGRYVRLAFEQELLGGEQRQLPGVELLPPGRQTAYAQLSIDDSGLAKVTSLSVVKPLYDDFIEVQVGVSSKQLYSLKFPFNRYYANEAKAPSMETTVRNQRRIDPTQTVTATVRVKNGRGVIAKLSVGDQSIEDFLLTSP
ncbi:GDYXXLXY domain-containing protein [Arenicella xantha]|uniref:GDYXXLXY motif protein n=1 Tax=Arenicella xantha TaxID=644221 RepID=A0A395JJB2_9GAMM|nr:GDYXXLXY domain-containing protein [Arenicella xantha]RBP48858.1 GDYXXLXY motif protein [Arenicella xantha]